MMRPVAVALIVGFLLGSVPGHAQPSAQRLRETREAAEKGIPAAQLILGRMLAESDPAESLGWLRRASDAGLAKADEAIGLAYLEGRGVPKNEVEAAGWLRRAAEKDEPVAQWTLAELVCRGLCSEAGENEAIRWYKAAAGQKDSPFAELLGDALADVYSRRAERYRLGVGVAADPVTIYVWDSAAALTREAPDLSGLDWVAQHLTPEQRAEAEKRVRRWAAREGLALTSDAAPLVALAEAARHERELRASAEAGDAAAQYRLARCLRLGEGLASDDAEAVEWYRRAAEAGHARAAYELALRYSSGRGLPQDQGLSYQWKLRAAEAGLAEAQYYLGLEVQFGHGKPDDAAAVGWYRRAAEQRHAMGEYALGLSYAKGQGVPKDEAEAARWFRRAADQGLSHAQLELGNLYAHGRGVKRDPFAAAFWLGLAARVEIEGEEGLRDAVARELGPERIADVERRIDTWIKSRRDDAGDPPAENPP